MDSLPIKTAQLHKHKLPVWGEKADILLQMKADMTRPDSPFEEIYARRVGDAQHGVLFEICCIPFFVYDLALGDRVQIIEHLGKQIVSDVIVSSGHHTFRAYFPHGNAQVRQDVTDEAERLGCVFEWFDNDLLGLDAPDDATAVRVARFLESEADKNRLDFETGRTHE